VAADSQAVAVVVAVAVAGSLDFAGVAVAAMAILLGWGVANVGIGLFRRKLTNQVRRYFWQMNLAWGLVDAALAAVTLRALATDYMRFATDRAFQVNQIKVIGLNIFLDVLYVLGGLALLKVNVQKRSARRQGYGRSIVVQGGFLLVFDLILFGLLRAASG